MTTTDNYIVIDLGYEDDAVVTSLSPAVFEKKVKSNNGKRPNTKTNKQPKKKQQQKDDFSDYRDPPIVRFLILVSLGLFVFLASQVPDGDWAALGQCMSVIAGTVYFILGRMQAIKTIRENTNNG